MRRGNFRQINRRNQLLGRLTGIKVNGPMAQATLSIGDQRIPSIITADAVREMHSELGQTVAALINSTEVMTIRIFSSDFLVVGSQDPLACHPVSKRLLA